MVAGQFFTQADAERNYSQTRAALEKYTNVELIQEYQDNVHASFDRMFGHNAKQFLRLVVDELLRRNITEIPNIFGNIPVRA